MKTVDYIKSQIHKLQRPSKETLLFNNILNQLNFINTHIITLSRLAFVKPEVLYKELKNDNANLDYVKKLLQLKLNETETIHEKNNQK